MDSEKNIISGTNSMDNITVNLDKTPEKYRSNAEQVVADFVELFRKYTKVTGIYMKQRNELIKQHKGVVRTAENWNDFDEYYACVDKLENDCRQDKMELLGEHITDNIYVTKFDLYPSRFDYFNTGCRIDFIMKSEKKITLDAIFNGDDYERQRFILRKQDNNWKIDWFGYSYEEEGYLRKDDL